MPYIKPDDRIPFVETLENVYIDESTSCGHLNYLLTCIILQYLGVNAKYQRYCEVEGVLGHITKELYRRRTAKYEDEKIFENGDVF